MTNNEATEAAAGKADILERLRKWANDGPCRNERPAMTTKAIEAGARAISRHDPHVSTIHEIAKACIEAAIASGALVPAAQLAAERERCARRAESHSTKEFDDAWIIAKCIRNLEPAIAVASDDLESVARIIDPDAWLLYDNANALTKMQKPVSLWRVEQSLAKADLIRALPPASGEYVVVPREPTEAMIQAGCEANPTQWNDGTDGGFAADVANDVYRAMLAASTKDGSGAL